jgi:predicted transcriptional regulator
MKHLKEMPGEKALALRLKLKMNQHDFWARVGVIQSSGCRFEKGGTVPRHVAITINLAYGKDPLKTVAELRGVAVNDLIAKVAA